MMTMPIMKDEIDDMRIKYLVSRDNDLRDEIEGGCSDQREVC